MPDYQQAKIYKLVCSETNKIYIGSTVQKLNRRRSSHIHQSQKYKCSSVSFINPTIHLLEDYPCNTKKELEERERYFIDNNDCVNKTIPTRTMKEWKESNKDKISIHNKTYKLKNQSKLDIYNKSFFVCDCGCKVRRDNKYNHLKTVKHLKLLESIN
jgi:predicted GIY-YIG superfamily endonuclease